MSISLGIYDFFAFTVPGLLYLYALNEFSKSVGWKFVDIESWFVSGQTPSLVFLVPILVGAYLIGHLLEPISQKFFNFFPRFSDRYDRTEWYMNSIKARYPKLKIKFELRDRTLLFALIRQRNIEMAKILDIFSANAIMLRNSALGFLILSVANTILFFSTNLLDQLFIALITFILCLLSIMNSNQYREWFVKDIFRASLEYGVNIEEVVSFTRDGRKVVNKSNSKTASKPKL